MNGKGHGAGPRLVKSGKRHPRKSHERNSAMLRLATAALEKITPS
jgi:hypothetical protein